MYVRRNWLLHSAVEVWLHSDPVLLGTATADAQGTFAVTYVVPTTVGPGEHTLVTAGVTRYLEPRTVAVPLVVIGDSQSGAPVPAVAPHPDAAPVAVAPELASLPVPAQAAPLGDLSAGELAATGAESVALLGLGVSLLAAGTGVIVAADRRRPKVWSLKAVG